MRLSAAEVSESLRDVEASMVEPVARAMQAQIAPDARRIRDALRVGDTATAAALAATMRLGLLPASLRARVRRATRLAAQLGAGLVDDPSRSIWARGAPFPREVDESAPALLIASAERSFARTVRPALVRRIEDAAKVEAERALTQKAALLDASKLASDINRFLAGEIRRVVDVSANLVGTRVAAFGMLHEARVRGVARYQIEATLDERTSDICKAMNGKVFIVEKSFEFVREVLSIDDPEALKKKAPLPKETAEFVESLRNMSADELQTMGFATPPFHFLCRSVVILLDNEVVEDAADLAPEAPWRAIGGAGDLTDAQVATLRASGLSPDAMLRALTPFADDPGAVSTVRYLSARDVLEVESASARGSAMRTLNLTTMVANHDYFEVIDRKGGVAKPVLRSSYETYRKMGLKEVKLNANIDVGAYAWARYGFVPTAREWESLKVRLNTRVLDVGLEPEVLGPVLKLLKSKDPKAIWAVADLDLPVGKTTLGKRLLLGLEWDGSLDLSDVEAVARFERYVGV